VKKNEGEINEEGINSNVAVEVDEIIREVVEYKIIENQQTPMVDIQE
jgi:hypothetical protein